MRNKRNGSSLRASLLTRPLKPSLLAETGSGTKNLSMTASTNGSSPLRADARSARSASCSALASAVTVRGVRTGAMVTGAVAITILYRHEGPIWLVYDTVVNRVHVWNSCDWAREIECL